MHARRRATVRADADRSEERVTARAILVLLCALLVASCARVQVAWRPYALSAPAHEPLLQRAVEVYEGDFPHLVRAGGQVIGTVYANGNRRAGSQRLLDAAARAAAAHGGTHFIVGAESTSTTVTGATTQTYGTASYTRVHTATLRAYAAVVIRVGRERLSELPGQLRPISGVHFDD